MTGRAPKSRPDDEDDEPRGFASPACLMHEIDPAYMGLEPDPPATPPAPPVPDATPGKPQARPAGKRGRTGVS